MNAEHLLQRLEAAEDAPLLRVGDTRTSSHEFVAEARRLAAALLAAGVERGTWMQLGDDRPDAFYVMAFAGWLAGCRVVFPTRDISGDADGFAYHTCVVRRAADGGIERSDGPAVPVPAEVPAAVDLVIFSSGSTGRPRGVAHHHGHFVRNAEAQSQVLALGRGYRSITPLRPYLVSAFSHFLVHAIDGAELCFVAFSALADLPSLYAEDPASAMIGSPLHVLSAMAHIPDGAHPRFFHTAGDFMYAANIAAVRGAHPGSRFFKVYGLAEIGGRFFVNAVDDETPRDRYEALGECLPGGAASVVDRELHVDGPFLFYGYLTADGWTPAARPHPTGDRVEARHGHWFLTGRLNHEVKVGGRKVTLPVIERAAAEAFEGASLAVVPIDHPRLGTLLVLAFEGAAPAARVELLRRLSAVLPAPQMPHRFVVVERLPRTASEKIDRGALRELLPTARRVE